VVLILTKPRDFVRSEKKDQKAVEILQKTYPEAAKQLALRYKKYNDSVVLAKEYEKQGKLLIVAPDNSCGMTTLLRTRLQLERMYQKGYAGAETILPFITA
jgi:predicted patatin/cPLA2 family phospholipase